MMKQETTIPAVVRTITVNAPVERAFSVFTERFTAWWPTGHQINPNGYEAAYIEPRVGGRWFERAPDGSEVDWGTVLVWEPPNRLVLTWQLNGEWEYDADPAHATEVEVRFTAEGSATRVDLVQGKLERAVHGAQLADGVGGQGGWNGLLKRYADCVAGRELEPLAG
jgi:uncharacterized protein YndB with AHSA1/START domain